MNFDIVSLPFIYNLRFLVAGDQKQTKNFIINNYQKYQCNSVVDLGCGTGDFAPIFSPNQYLGIDFNQKYIIFAQKRYPQYNFVCQDITTIDLRKRCFDSSLILSTMHHLNDQQINNLLTRAVNFTRKIIIIVDLNPHPQTSLIKKLVINLDRGKYVRNSQQKSTIITKFGQIEEFSNFSTGLASQTGMVLTPTK